MDVDAFLFCCCFLAKNREGKEKKKKRTRTRKGAPTANTNHKRTHERARARGKKTTKEKKRYTLCSSCKARPKNDEEVERREEGDTTQGLTKKKKQIARNDNQKELEERTQTRERKDEKMERAYEPTTVTARAGCSL